MNYSNYIINKVDIKLYLYLILAFVFLITIGISAVKGEIDFEFYADSETYIQFMSERESLTNILLLYPNMLGPTIILTVLNESFVLVYLFNASIVLFFYYTFSQLYSIKRMYLLFYFFISVMFFSSVISINKEIISLFSLALFFRYHKTKSYIVLVLSILISFLVRWQMTLFIVCLTILMANRNPLKNYKFILALLFLFLISIIYFLNINSFEQFNLIAELGQESSEEGSGLFNMLLNIQNSSIFGYFIVFIPKFLFLFVGTLARYYKLLDTSDFYNNVIVFLQSAANCFLLIDLIRSKIKLDNIFLFSAIIYCIIFALSPIFSPRYFFPAYILFSLSIVSNNRLST
jgi:hypothetical protein